MHKLIDGCSELAKLIDTKLSATTKVNGIKASLFNCDVSHTNTPTLREMAQELDQAKMRIDSFETLLVSEIDQRQKIISLLQQEMKAHEAQLNELKNKIFDCKKQTAELEENGKKVQNRIEGC